MAARCGRSSTPSGSRRTARRRRNARRAAGCSTGSARRFPGHWPLAYARVDLLPAAEGPLLLELELAEPSLFLGFARGAAARFARVLAGRLGALAAG
ncbi:MAG: hypothetical protein RML12_02225 [Xanthomonadales bacterium]|nr:hypothetical protein [Xanthomonadales bacterium]